MLLEHSTSSSTAPLAAHPAVHTSVDISVHTSAHTAVHTAARAGKLLFTPGFCNTRKYYNCYSSTNYVLLGCAPRTAFPPSAHAPAYAQPHAHLSVHSRSSRSLLLAAKSGAETWDDYTQMAGIQPAASQAATPLPRISPPYERVTLEGTVRHNPTVPSLFRVRSSAPWTSP